jgi:hypothetical protein
MAIEARNGAREQLPFRKRTGIAYGFPTLDLEYDAVTSVPGGRQIRQPMILYSGDLCNAVLRLMTMYNDLLEENNQREKNYEHDQRTIASLEGEILRLKNSARGHENKPLKK